jgi:hypothetical protein
MTLKYFPKPLFVGSVLLCVLVPATFYIHHSLKAQDSEDPKTRTPKEIVQKHPVKSLPGSLDNIPVFNSDSPEWVKSEGILLSTFSTEGKKNAPAHLNYAFQGRFDVFAHHFSHTPKDLQTLYIGIIVQNPSQKKVTLDTLQAASYLMQDAPFIKKPNRVEDPDGTTYSGPGARAVAEVLRGKRQSDFLGKITLKPGESKLLLNHPIPVKNLLLPINGRSTFLRLKSSGKVYVASLAMYAKKDANGKEIKPILSDWKNLLKTGNLAGPRDKTPTPPGQTSGQFIYGRVAGVSQGATWKGKFTELDISTLKAPVSYPISTLFGGTLGTRQIQTAKMLVRYPDTAYFAHGNYCVEYQLSLPFYNSSDRPKTVTLNLQTPIKEDKLSKEGLLFHQPPLDSPFFRGTVKLSYRDKQNKSVTKYLHLWQRRGEIVEPLLSWEVPPQSRQQIQVDLFYPPDSTPPQVLTIQSL